ncbi:MAG: DUF2007 domain-containing protein [Hyphomicrobiaceae bacterium]|nr:DUF2007 domain-containing protein [Hyphomicrobiaceae bacterium]
MREIVKTNDPVLLSYLEALFAEAGIECAVFDTHMSILEGSVGVLPRRVLVADGHFHAARRLILDAGLGAWLVSEAAR